jgi:hypothetical protein
MPTLREMLKSSELER